MRALGTAFAFLAAVACGCGGPASGNSSAGATSAGTATATQTSGATGTGTPGSASGTSGGSTSSGSSSAAASSGGSSGTVPRCSANAVWIHNVCTLTSCVSQSIGATCLLPDGGVSFCAAGICQGVDLASDPNNCGYFGLQCLPGQSCTGSICTGVCEGNGSQSCPTGTACIRGQSCAPTSCTATMTDQACAIDSSQGYCCGTSCLLGGGTSDCGACGLACGDGEYCDDELGCVAVLPCDAGQENAPCALQSAAQYSGFCCHGVCEDPALDTTDCQACGQSCTACTFGSDAGCPVGQGCTVDSLCAPTSCGGLADGLACSTQPSVRGPYPNGQSAGSWLGQEQVLTECCNGACVDLDFDSSNCGSCGAVCPEAMACQGGVCIQSVNCSAAANGSPCSLADAGGEGVCCSGACVDTTSDPLNCQNCGQECPTGSLCTSKGFCVDSDGGDVAATLSTTCGPGSEGEVCLGGICCGGACLALGSFESCAACGLGCPSCNAGCGPGTACVSKGAVKLPDGGRSPLDYCLPTACAPGVSGGECAFGSWPDAPIPTEFRGPGAVSAFQAFQLGGPGYCCDGACVNIGEDANNCGLCGVVCPSGVCTLAFGWQAVCLAPGPSDDCLATCGSGEVCVLGACVGSSCDQDQDLFPYCVAQDGNVGVCCPGTSAGVPCADAANDPANCGSCGFECPAGQSCSHGVCSGASAGCGIGRIGAFCDLDAGPSYLCCPGVGCINTDSDNANCGNCGTVCAAGTSCQNGSCQ
jgi:hypothetical protein